MFNLKYDMISIIVPVYNVEEYLPKCLDSILNQTYTNIEIILIDDGSTDNSSFLCDAFAKRNSIIKVIHKVNGGLSDARNVGIESSSGEYILLVDSDDYIELDACERLMNTMKQTEVDFVVGAIREVSGGIIKYQRRSMIEENTAYNAGEFILKSIEANEWYAPSVLNLYKKEFISKNGLMFKYNRLFEDMELLPRLYLSAERISYLDYAFYNYVIRNNSITNSSVTDKKIHDSLQNLTEWKLLFDHITKKELKKKLNGVLVKHYLHTCRVMGIKGWRIEGVDFKFAVKNALNLKEIIKVIYFGFLPGLYVANKAKYK